MSDSIPPPSMPPPSGDPAPGATAPPAGPRPAGSSRALAVKLLGGAAVIAVIVVVVLVAFGSSSNSSVDPIAKAATASTSTSGYKLLLTMNISSPALPSAITGSGSGSFSTHGRTGTMSLTMHVPTSSGATSLTVQEILDGQTVYLQLPAAEMSQLGVNGKKWLAVNFAKLSGIPELSSLESNPASSNPSEMLDYLKAASGGVDNEGHAVVDGYQTTRYHATLSLSKIPNALPASDRAGARQALAKLQTLAHVNDFPVDVWVDSRHLVRRIALTISASADGQSINEGFTIDIPQYGPQPPPTIPPASQVTNASSLSGLSSSSG